MNSSNPNIVNISQNQKKPEEMRRLPLKTPTNNVPKNFNSNENSHNLNLPSNSKRPPKQMKDDIIRVNPSHKGQTPLNFSSSSSKLKENLLNYNELRSSFNDNFHYGMDDKGGKRSEEQPPVIRKISKNSYHNISNEKEKYSVIKR